MKNKTNKNIHTCKIKLREKKQQKIKDKTTIQPMSRQTDEGDMFLQSATLLPRSELHGDGRRGPMWTVPSRLHWKRANL